MDTVKPGRAGARILLAPWCLLLFVAAINPWSTPRIHAQGLTGALIGTVQDATGLALASATVRISSPALIGGKEEQPTNDRGQFRFQNLVPGLYTLEVHHPGFRAYRVEDIR